LFSFEKSSIDFFFFLEFFPRDVDLYSEFRTVGSEYQVSFLVDP